MNYLNLSIMSNLLTAEIFCLGNELLIGRTINRNANEIAFELTKIGIHVERETTVRDNEISATSTLMEIINRKPSVVVITGGLGPTHDDIQLKVVSKAIGQQLSLNNKAVEMLEKRYNKSKEEIAENQLKMAYLPKNSFPLNNSEGSAPGVKIKYLSSIIYCLPGVPREMRAILKQEVIKDIIEEFSPGSQMYEFGFSVRGVGEAKLVDFTDQVRSNYPDVGFKTHPRKDGDMYWVELHTYKLDTSNTEVEKAIEDWRKLIIQNLDAKVSEVSPLFTENFIPE